MYNKGLTMRGILRNPTYKSLQIHVDDRKFSLDSASG